MATVKLCDRCGRRMLPDHMRAGRVITTEPGERFDLCNRCYVKFKEFMRGRELMPDPRDSLPVAPVRDDNEGGPAGSRAPTRERSAGGTSSVGSADTFPSRGRLGKEAET